ncbi:MAG: sigma-70 family RNA polymerase sigma factor, partial [Planctomycetota bacterium]
MNFFREVAGVDKRGLELQQTHEDHVAFLRGVVRRILSDEQLIDDVVQETYIAAWRNSLSQIRRRRSWLARTARNIALMRLRSERRREHHEHSVSRRQDVESVLSLLERRETRQLLLKALGRLSEPHRMAIHLRYMDEFDYGEIGARLSVSADAARARVRRSVDALRREIDRDEIFVRPRGLQLIPMLFGLPRRANATPRSVPRRVLWTGAAVLCVAAVVGILAWARPEAMTSARADRAAVADVRGDKRTQPTEDASSADSDPNRIAGPDVRIAGRVRAEGEPADGARVRVLRAYERPESPVPTHTHPITEGAVDARGEFALSIRRRTRFAVEVDYEGYAPANLLVIVPLEGDPPALDLRLARAFVTEGTVFGPEGKSLPGVRVQARQGSGFTAPVERHSVTDARGRFRFDLREPDMHAPLSLRAEADGYATLVREVKPEFVLHGVPTHVRLRFQQPAVLHGTVRTPDGHTASGVRVRARVRIDDATWSVEETTTDAEGRYRLSGLPPLTVTRIALVPPVGSAYAVFDEAPVETTLDRKQPTMLDLTLRESVAVKGLTRTRAHQPVPDA